MKEHIAIISFDCYGTLVDWEKGVKEAFIEIIGNQVKNYDLDELFKAWEREDFRIVQGSYKPYREVIATSLRSITRMYDLPYLEHYSDKFANLMKKWEPFPDVKPALNELSKSYHLAIISNTDNDIIEQSIKNIGIIFDYVITSEDARCYKPSKEIFEFALEKLKIEPSNIIQVAFGFDYDIVPAKSMGFSTIWVNRKNEKAPTNISPDAIVRNLLELESSIQALL